MTGDAITDQHVFAILSIMVSVMAVQITIRTMRLDLSKEDWLSRINIGIRWPILAVVIALIGWSRALELGPDDDPSLGVYAFGFAYVTVIWLATGRQGPGHSE